MIECGTIIEHDCLGVVIERPVVNIDEPWDLELANYLASKPPEDQPPDCRASAAGPVGPP